MFITQKVETIAPKGAQKLWPVLFFGIINLYLYSIQYNYWCLSSCTYIEHQIEQQLAPEKAIKYAYKPTRYYLDTNKMLEITLHKNLSRWPIYIFAY